MNSLVVDSVASPLITEDQSMLDLLDLEQLREQVEPEWRELVNIKKEPKTFLQYDVSQKYTFVSPKAKMIQASSFFSLNGDISFLFKDSPFWLDISNPKESDFRIFSKIFNVHPLTIEDIQTSDTREKCEMFDDYVFISIACTGKDFGFLHEPTNFNIILFKNYILTVHYFPLANLRNIIRRIEQSLFKITCDWVMYVIIDDITDSYIPIIKTMEMEIDTIDDLVLVLSEKDQTDLLRRIGGCRKRVTQLLRLLGPKSDVLKMLFKRCSHRLSSPVTIYLRDIQDHVIEMLQNLDQYSETLNRSHSNYLAQISIELTQASNRMSSIMKTFTACASILLPLQLISGIWGMNVFVPGQPLTPGLEADYTAFFLIVSGMAIIMVSLFVVGRRRDWF